MHSPARRVGAGFSWRCGRSLHRCSARCAETVATRPAPLAGSLRQGSLRSLWTQGDWSSALLQHPWPPGTADDTRGQWHILVCKRSPCLNGTYWCITQLEKFIRYACPKPERQKLFSFHQINIWRLSPIPIQATATSHKRNWTIAKKKIIQVALQRPYVRHAHSDKLCIKNRVRVTFHPRQGASICPALRRDQGAGTYL